MYNLKNRFFPINPMLTLNSNSKEKEIWLNALRIGLVVFVLSEVVP